MISLPEARAHETRAPSASNAADIFAGSWTTAIPGVTSGNLDLTSDDRILEVERLAGAFSDKRILEIGALEGAHTWMMAKRGGRVTAIEADKAAYLRALVARQILGYDAEWLLGDATLFEAPPDSFDLVVCSGVLYHLMEPLALLDRLKAMAPRLYLWTHIYTDAVPEHPVAAGHFQRPPEMVGGVEHHPYDYAEALDRADFSGGFKPEARWIRKEALLNALDGWDIQVFGEWAEHPHGPCLSLYAAR